MTLRILFGSLGFVLLLLSAAAYRAEFTASWADYQRAYNRLLADRTTDASLKEQLLRRWPVFEQIYNAELGVVDRCILCHRGLDNPAMAGAPQPHAPHPGNLLEHHPYQTFGCTLCHQGQGRATERDAAWGHVPGWDKPLLTGSFTQATCTRCHTGEQVPQAPMLTKGKRLMRDRGCVACHEIGGMEGDPRIAPDLSGIGSKVDRAWLARWLLRPRGVLPTAKMPDFRLRKGEREALSAYLMTLRDSAVDTAPPVPKGSYEGGETLYKRLQCIDCHVTKFDREGRPIGGTVGPALVQVATKTNRRWLYAWLRETHRIQPRTKMPHFKLTDQQAADLVAFIAEEWTDAAVKEPVRDGPEPAPGPELREEIGIGRQLFGNYGCAGCHGSEQGPSKVRIGPELTYVGGKELHMIEFGRTNIRHTRPDYFFAKVKNPRGFSKGLDLPGHRLPDAELLQKIWKGLTPQALFSGRTTLPEGAPDQTARWIQARVQAEGYLQAPSAPPPGDPQGLVRWLHDELDKDGAFNVLKMPDFGLEEEDALALTIALMSFTGERPPSDRYLAKPAAGRQFDTRGRVGELFDRYRCLSCHSVGDKGTLLAADLSREGSRVNRDWLFNFLKKPYSMRQTLTIAMPLFGLDDEEARTLADYFFLVTADDDIPQHLQPPPTTQEAAQGKLLFRQKGCHACHQTPEGGGTVGPSLSTQAPDYPVDTWAGDKLREGWVARWLENPQALLPDAVEPRLKLSASEVRQLTAYVMSLKRAAFQPVAPKGGKL
ncbi:MAG: c-type cytochrome [Candidatus Wallbacteria bacterium]|nr:c-type cytochrome [Candidatus Wallbacteria bacterium]